MKRVSISLHDAIYEKIRDDDGSLREEGAFCTKHLPSIEEQESME